MLRQLNDLTKLPLKAVDGEIGSLHDIYFDDQSWATRYAVVDTGPWLFGRHVLISPSAFGAIDEEVDWIQVHLTKTQIENSPAVDLEKPVSRQQEIALQEHYGWSAYWNFLDGSGMSPHAEEVIHERKRQELEDSDPTLRSADEVEGYHIQASDGAIGHIADFIVDDVTWFIRYLVVDTRNWLPGRKVLVARDWIDRVSWYDAKVYLNLTRDSIRHGPEYDDRMPIDDAYEKMLFDYYKAYSAVAV